MSQPQLSENEKAELVKVQTQLVQIKEAMESNDLASAYFKVELMIGYLHFLGVESLI
jgi:hypothetical protein